MKKMKTSVLNRTMALLLAAVVLVSTSPDIVTQVWGAAEGNDEAALDTDLMLETTGEDIEAAVAEDAVETDAADETAAEVITETLPEEEIIEALPAEDPTQAQAADDNTTKTAAEEDEVKESIFDTCETGYLFKLTEDAPPPEEELGFAHIGELIYSVGTLETLYEYYSEDDLVFVEENLEMEFFDDPDDTYYSQQEVYLSNTNSQSFWDSSYGLDYSDVTIAIIDSGLAEDHEDFAGNNVVAGKNYTLSSGVVSVGTDPKDTNGHGTQVTGIISAIQNNGKGIAGLTSGAKIVPLSVANASGTLVFGTVSKAIYDAVDEYDADVINLSLGASTQSDAVDEAVAYAIENGTIVVAAVGNDGSETALPLYPAACEGVIGVGSVDNTNTVRANSHKNESVFVTAPGEYIYTLTTNNRYANKAGTSFSAPFVTAMAAAARAYDGDITNEAFQQLLIKTSTDAGDSGYDTSYGHGIINVEKFLDQLTDNSGSVAMSFYYAADYGSKLDDAFNAVARTKDGGYVAVGYSLAASTDPEWGYVANSSGYSYNDAIAVIFDSKMNVIWSDNFGTSGADIFNDVTVLDDGTIVAVGQISHSFAEGGTAKVTGQIVTIDPVTYESTLTYIGGDKGGDYLHGVTATSDGGYAVSGRVASYDSDDYTKVHSAATTMDGLILKYAADGTLQFSNCYNSVSGKRSYFYDIAEDNDGNLVAVGDHQIALNLYNSQIVKFSGTDGSILWSKSAGSSKTEAVSSAVFGHTSVYSAVTILNDGTYVVAGATKNNGSDTGENWGITGDQDGIIVRYRPDGTVISSENIGELSSEVEFENVVATKDGGYIVIGATSHKVSDYWTITGTSDPVMVKYNENHNRVWSQSYGSENALAVVNDLIEDESGEFVGVGESNWNRDTHKVNATIWSTKYYPKKVAVVEEEEEKIEYADGVYTGTAQGYNGIVTVQVTITDGAIVSAAVTDHTDTADMMQSAMAVIDSIVSSQSTKVDSVSGATVSSNAIKEAVAQALSDAAKEAENPTYSITYVLDGGTNSEDSITEYTAEDSFSLASPTRTGYIFDGWYTDFTTKVTEVEVGTTGELTFYAKWSAATYEVTFNANGGKNLSSSSKSVTYEKAYGTLPTVERSGYTFKGWYTAKSGGSKVAKNTSVSITKAQTLYAQWTAASYKVTFKANGGTKLSSSSKTVTYAKTYGTLPTVQRKGYTFKGWYTAKSGGSKITTGKTVSITKAQTLYAQWTKVTKPGKVTVSSAKNSVAKKIVVNIKTVSGAKGYEISYSTNKKFTSAKKITTSSLKKTITGLTKGKTYYVKVRAYKVDSAGNKVYGAYSAVKKITITK